MYYGELSIFLDVAFHGLIVGILVVKSMDVL